MTKEEVRFYLGLSKSSADKIYAGHTEGFSPETVNAFKFLTNLNKGFLQALFTRAEFGDMVSLVLSKCTKRHHKQSCEILRLADKCLRRHNTLRKEFTVKGITDDDFSIGELLGIYLGEAKDLVLDPLFQPMCDVALELSAKDRDLRSFIAFMHDVSGFWQKRGNKKEAGNAVP